MKQVSIRECESYDYDILKQRLREMAFLTKDLKYETGF